jgi:16S rRNA (cytosine1402-N4)-methyltransferase
VKTVIEPTTIREEMAQAYHYPVMYREVADYLNVKNKRVVVDGTLGMGSHAAGLLSQMSPGSRFIGIDKDEESLELARQSLEAYSDKISLIQADFSDIDRVVASVPAGAPDAILLDLGISTYQLNSERRGFSFLRPGPLDMRMDRNAFLSAYDLVNNLSEEELANIFKRFGQERYHKRIAAAIIQARKRAPIATTCDLARIISDVAGSRYKAYKIHPATRSFQALRIVVNRELLVLECGLKKAIEVLAHQGLIAVISFHSLEDRIVKHTLKEYALKGEISILTKKPLRPQAEELINNPASRSAKLRVAQKNKKP